MSCLSGWVRVDCVIGRDSSFYRAKSIELGKGSWEDWTWVDWIEST